MSLAPPPPVLVMGFATLLTGWVALYSARNRAAVGATSLAVLAGAAAVWSGGGVLQLLSETLAGKLLWTNLIYVGIAVLPTAWLAFALEYSGYSGWLTPRRVALLAVEPAAVLVLVWTNDFHHLYWSSAGLATVDGTAVLEPRPGPGFFVNVAYSYLVIAAGIALVFRQAMVGGRRYRGQALALLLVAFVPWITNVFHLVGVLRSVSDPTPVAFAASALGLAWAVHRRELLDLVPATRRVAREELIESMSDGVVVVNEQGLVVDLNPAGALLIGSSRADAVGNPLAAVAPDLEAALPDEPPREWQRASLTLDRGGGERHYDVRISPVGGEDGSIGGSLIVLRDVTERQRQQQRLAVLNRVLRHDLRNEMNVLLGEAEDLIADGDDVRTRARRIREKGLEITSLSDRARDLERTIADDEAVLERVDLVAVVERLADAIARDYPDVTVETDLPGRAPVYANELIDSAVRNLVENAVEHNDRDSPTVHLGIDVGEEFVELRVADDGPGVPAEERAVIAEGTETQLHHSSGLGLWLVNWIVTESGGTIAFADNEPRGTVVTVSLTAADG